MCEVQKQQQQQKGPSYMVFPCVALLMYFNDQRSIFMISTNEKMLLFPPKPVSQAIPSKVHYWLLIEFPTSQFLCLRPILDQ